MQDFHLEIYRIWPHRTFMMTLFYTMEKVASVLKIVSEGDKPSGFMVENKKVNDQSMDHSARFSSEVILYTAFKYFCSVQLLH